MSSTTTVEEAQVHKPTVVPNDGTIPNSGSNTSISGLGKRIHREVRFGNYILGSTLGEGEFGKVKLGWRKDGKQPSQVAIKLIKRESIAKDSDSEIKVHREINSLKLLNHPNIVNLVEVMKSGKYIGIVLEYASGGELFDYILHHKYLKENVAKKIFAQLVSGVDYMHSKGLIHRDLKLENLLLDKHKNVIISDFGFVNSYNKDKNDLMKTSCGSPCYAAPELVLTQSPYEGKKVDIWSLGVILYAMLSGYLPFDDDPDNVDGADIVKLYRYICKTPLTFPEYVSPLARDLLRKIIVPDPRKRIKMDDIRNHPWLTPHVNLLSIRQPEWDRIHRENKTPMIARSQNKRFSMLPERTNSSTLAPARGRSTSNSNVVSQLYIHPAPTTSRSLANAIAINSSGTQQVTGITPTFEASNSTADTRSSPSPTKSYQRGHVKSASMSGSYPSASIALKAVVSDNEFKRNSITSINSTSSSQFSASKCSGPLNANVSRSSTFIGSSTIPTIVESPTRSDNKSDVNVLDNKKQSENAFIALLPLSNNRERLPPSGKKPRPTSYHPSSLSSSLFATNNSSATGILDYMNFQFLNGSPPKTSSVAQIDTNSVRESSNSPTSGVKSAASAHSRRNSVITPVHVNGVLTSEHSNNDNNKNAVLNYLEDKMDALELTESHSPVKSTFIVTPEINQVPQFDAQVGTPTTVGASNGIKEGSIEQNPTPLTEISKEENTSSCAANEKMDKTQRKEAKKEVKGNKENKENKEVKEQKKRNRFSILSFYSTYSSSSNNIPALSANSTSASTNKKVLEVSTDVNISNSIKEKKRIVSAGSSNSSKSSSSSSKKSSSSTGNTTNKEASAARKVLDFFKRRSVRVG